MFKVNAPKDVALITGIDGQDGSYLAELLLSHGYEVHGITRSTNLKRVSHLPLKIYTGDITDPVFINRVLAQSRPSELYNLAALSQVGNSFSCPIETNRVNYLGTLNILTAIVDLNMQRAVKFYQASTSEMFGSNRNNDNAQNEETSFNPNSPYGLSKLAAHNAVDYFRRAYSLRATCGILYNHESNRRGDTFVTKKITRFIGALDNFNHTGNSHIFNGMDVEWRNDKPVLKLGNLYASRDWSHAKDMVYGMFLLMGQDDEKMRTSAADYVVSSGQTHTVREFAALSFSLLSLNYSDHIVVTDEFKRDCEVPYLRGDSSRLRKDFGWEPKVTFEQLVKEMVNYEVETCSRH